jgi:hypothetical protein
VIRRMADDNMEMAAKVKIIRKTIFKTNFFCLKKRIFFSIGRFDKLLVFFLIKMEQNI